ncbi:hypothetical protein DDB_G0294326 [Dictyostelium discoideum AX4]|uniref:Uncharacterized protein n=1 Tax=Dictyostelium discoideum TaxID=44689 RepID=Q54AN3_DICDI|nr:hypothetical protein DDB_G0294326 [Dictyostelium discoideum AX4]EAL60319.1 hypothetical protein DDB_G0294326 [Dictyostelium discoideum AX4]|eukprot:XP_628732.1 hypothetical protein DDB_G0294326 [Dictyostelium discoideum AX4]
MENQRIIIRRVPRPTVPPIQETVQIATNPRVTYILEYESLQKVCQSKYYSDGDVSNFFITGIIKQAGGSNEDCTSQNIFERLTKWVSNKKSNTRTKVADSLAIYSKGEKNHNLKVYISDNQVFFGNEIVFFPCFTFSEKFRTDTMHKVVKGRKLLFFLSFAKFLRK